MTETERSLRAAGAWGGGCRGGVRGLGRAGRGCSRTIVLVDPGGGERRAQGPMYDIYEMIVFQQYNAAGAAGGAGGAAAL